MVAEVWSGSDSPYTCLKDVARTEAFRRAIHGVVRPGDVVVDAGAGTGILSFFAVEAGAARVYAVEIDPGLAAALRVSVALNGLENRVVVVAGDARTVELPLEVDVFVGELIETGLIEETQVAVVNALRARGVIGPRTRVIPDGYETAIELVEVEAAFYGYRIAAPLHEWPNYRGAEAGRLRTPVRALTARAVVAGVDLRRPVEPRLTRTLSLTAVADGVANAVRLSGRARLAPGHWLGQTNALNGDKILRLAAPVPVGVGQGLRGRIAYVMGGGLGSFTCEAVAEPAREPAGVTRAG